MNSISHRLSFKSSFYIILLYVHIYFEFKINTFKPKVKKYANIRNRSNQNPSPALKIQIGK